jgi:hypothetical protein
MEDKYTIEISEDEAIVLFEYFARFGDTNNLEFEHPAEFVALCKISGQIDKTTAAMFKPEYAELLANARNRIAGDYEGDYPGMKTKLSILKSKIKAITSRSMGSASAVAAFVPFELCFCVLQSSFTWPPHELRR